MRRALRVVPALALGGLLGGLVVMLLATAAVPFLARRVVETTTSFELKQLVVVMGLAGVVLGGVTGAVVRLGVALLRRPDDPPPKKPPLRTPLMMLIGAAIGGFFGYGLHPVFLVALARYSNAQVLLTPGTFIGISAIAGVSFGVVAAGFVIGLVPSIAPVHRRVRVRAQHLYEGPVTDMNELAILVNRIREGGEDALAAGKDFYLT